MLRYVLVTMISLSMFGCGIGPPKMNGPKFEVYVHSIEVSHYPYKVIGESNGERRVYILANGSTLPLAGETWEVQGQYKTTNIWINFLHQVDRND